MAIRVVSSNNRPSPLPQKVGIGAKLKPSEDDNSKDRKRREAERGAQRRHRARDSQTNSWHTPSYRERLQERFLHKGSDALTSYELLELLLSVACPKRDIKVLAADLFRRFGSLGAIMSASKQRLDEISGMDDVMITALKISKAAALALQREEIIDQPVINSWKSLIGYCRSAMAHEVNEQLRILFLNKKNVLMADEVQSYGTVDQTPIYTREVIKRTLEIGATAIIIVHNHPSGDPAPSREDIEITRELKEAAAKLDIVLHDHLIIARSGHVSFKTLGLL